MAGETHYYRIRALPQTMVNDDGETVADPDAGWSAEDELAETGDDAPEDSTVGMTMVDGPGPPTQTAVPEATSSSVTISWTQPGDIGGSAITKYEVYKWNGSSWVYEDDVSAVANQTAYTYEDMGLAAGTTHYYIVRAVNDHGPGDWSQVWSDTTDSGDIEAPTLTATQRSTTEIQLTWNVPAANGNTITGYTLQRWDNTAFATIMVLTPETTDAADAVEALTLTADTTLYVDIGRAPGTQYWYQIQATGTDPNDNNDPATTVYSGVATATTVSAPPERPVVSAEDDDITHNSIKLTWDEPKDNGNAIIHYEVQLWDTSGPTNQWTRLALISATHTEYTHRNLDAETRYIYRVRAQNRAPGAAGGFGSFSTVVSATTTAEEPEE